MLRRLLLLALALAACAEPRPQVTLWAWESRQDLRFLPPEIDVALLAADVTVSPTRLDVRRRVQPALLPDGKRPLAVVHLVTHGAGISETQLAPLVDALLERVETFDAPELQLDFDARESERDDLVRLLTALRARLGTRRLSMTGLASWCAEDWLHSAPVDEVIPQLFRLGPEAERWRRRFDSGALAGCGQSVGLSTDERVSRIPGARRVFLFHPGSWSREALDTALRNLE